MSDHAPGPFDDLFGSYGPATLTANAAWLVEVVLTDDPFLDPDWSDLETTGRVGRYRGIELRVSDKDSVVPLLAAWAAEKTGGRVVAGRVVEVPATDALEARPRLWDPETRASELQKGILGAFGPVRVVARARWVPSPAVDLSRTSRGSA